MFITLLNITGPLIGHKKPITLHVYFEFLYFWYMFVSGEGCMYFI